MGIPEIRSLKGTINSNNSSASNKINEKQNKTIINSRLCAAASINVEIQQKQMIKI